MRRATGPLLALMLLLTGCGTKVYLKSYPIEPPAASYKRLRIGVPTAGVGAETRVKGLSLRNGGGVVTMVDADNILAIVQHEVMRNLQGAGKTVALVDSNADLDLQIAFQPPSRKLSLIGLATLGIVKNYESLGGAKLVDTKSGNVLFTYEFVMSNHTTIPPTRIQDWENFAKLLAAEINKTLQKLQLASNSTINLRVTAG